MGHYWVRDEHPTDIDGVIYECSCGYTIGLSGREIVRTPGGVKALLEKAHPDAAPLTR